MEYLIENFVETNIIVYTFIKIVLPITLFIGIILICVRLGAILELLEEIKEKSNKK